jgi:hypothetical protein
MPIGDMTEDALEQTIRQVVDRSALLNRNTEDWQPITSYQNGWAGYSGDVLEYCRDPGGFVHLRGELVPGTLTSGTIICQLPVAPAERVYFMCVGGTGAATTWAAFMVDSSGYLRVADHGSAAAAAAIYSFAPITFRAEL